VTTVILGIILGLAVVAYAYWNAATQANPAAPAALSSTPTIPGVTAIPGPEPIKLLVPTANIDTPIVEIYLSGTSWDVSGLGMNAGHLHGTAWIEAPGNIVLAGHVEMGDGQRGVFARLTDVQINDSVFLYQGTARRRYVVTRVQTVAPEDLSVLYPTESDRLTLITCLSYDFVQDAYQERLVVIADRVR